MTSLENTSENGQSLTAQRHRDPRSAVRGAEYENAECDYRKIRLGILTCTPTFWSTSWVITTLPATLVS